MRSINVIIMIKNALSQNDHIKRMIIMIILKSQFQIASIYNRQGFFTFLFHGPLKAEPVPIKTV